METFLDELFRIKPQQFMVFAIILEFIRSLTSFPKEEPWIAFLLMLTYLYRKDFQNFFIKFLFGLSFFSGSLTLYNISSFMLDIDPSKGITRDKAACADIISRMLLVSFIINILTVFVAIQFFEFSRKEKLRLATVLRDPTAAPVR